ncbi:unnamed protein product [Larinioides sclopetarius]|uniref:Uncharacterized protein n=1 Tax=Larinioides sclopetarius TaxID=280406 RepID=A0AAV1ZQ35_9ARAC
MSSMFMTLAENEKSFEIRHFKLMDLMQCLGTSYFIHFLKLALKNMASKEEYSSSTPSDGAVLQRPSKILRLQSDSKKSSLSSSLDMIRASTVQRYGCDRRKRK